MEPNSSHSRESSCTSPPLSASPRDTSSLSPPSTASTESSRKRARLDTDDTEEREREVRRGSSTSFSSEDTLAGSCGSGSIGGDTTVTSVAVGSFGDKGVITSGQSSPISFMSSSFKQIPTPTSAPTTPRAPIQNLDNVPLEAFISIFSSYLPWRSLIYGTHVCKRWREALLNEPKLWVDQTVWLNKLTDLEPGGYMEQALRRCKGTYGLRTLTVRLGAFGGRRTVDVGGGRLLVVDDWDPRFIAGSVKKLFVLLAGYSTVVNNNDVAVVGRNDEDKEDIVLDGEPQQASAEDEGSRNGPKSSSAPLAAAVDEPKALCLALAGRGDATMIALSHFLHSLRTDLGFGLPKWARMFTDLHVQCELPRILLRDYFFAFFQLLPSLERIELRSYRSPEEVQFLQFNPGQTYDFAQHPYAVTDHPNLQPSLDLAMPTNHLPAPLFPAAASSLERLTLVSTVMCPGICLPVKWSNLTLLEAIDVPFGEAVLWKMLMVAPNLERLVLGSCLVQGGVGQLFHVAGRGGGAGLSEQERVRPGDMERLARERERERGREEERDWERNQAGDATDAIMAATEAGLDEIDIDEDIIKAQQKEWDMIQAQRRGKEGDAPARISEERKSGQEVGGMREEGNGDEPLEEVGDEDEGGGGGIEHVMGDVEAEGANGHERGRMLSRESAPPPSTPPRPIPPAIRNGDHMAPPSARRTASRTREDARSIPHTNGSSRVQTPSSSSRAVPQTPLGPHANHSQLVRKGYAPIVLPKLRELVCTYRTPAFWTGFGGDAIQSMVALDPTLPAGNLPFRGFEQPPPMPIVEMPALQSVELVGTNVVRPPYEYIYPQSHSVNPNNVDANATYDGSSVGEEEEEDEYGDGMDTFSELGSEYEEDPWAFCGEEELEQRQLEWALQETRKSAEEAQEVAVAQEEKAREESREGKPAVASAPASDIEVKVSATEHAPVKVGPDVNVKETKAEETEEKPKPRAKQIAEAIPVSEPAAPRQIPLPVLPPPPRPPLPSLMSLIFSCPKISHLNLDNVVNANDEVLFQCLGKLPNLEYLSLGRTSITDNLVRNLPELTPSLKKLNLRGCRFVTPRAVAVCVERTRRATDGFGGIKLVALDQYSHEEYAYSEDQKALSWLEWISVLADVMHSDGRKAKGKIRQASVQR